MTAKAGQSALVDLDQYRYHEAVEVFGSDKDAPSMTLDDVKRLVEWKLYVQLHPALRVSCVLVQLTSLAVDTANSGQRS